MDTQSAPIGAAEAARLVDQIVDRADRVRQFRPDLFPDVYARSFVQTHRHEHELARAEANIGFPDYARLDDRACDDIIERYAQLTGQDADAARFVFARGFLLERAVTGWTDPQLRHLVGFAPLDPGTGGVPGLDDDTRRRILDGLHRDDDT